MGASGRKLIYTKLVYNLAGNFIDCEILKEGEKASKKFRTAWRERGMKQNETRGTIM